MSSLLICYCLIIIYKYHFYTKVHCSRFQSALYYRKKQNPSIIVIMRNIFCNYIKFDFVPFLLKISFNLK